MALIFSCQTGKKFIDTKIEESVVPYNIALSPLAPVKNVKWTLDGTVCLVGKDQNLLITQSGKHVLKGIYYHDGKRDSVKYLFDALPPEDQCLVEISTDKGTMVAQLSSEAPQHSDHFENLVEMGYYDSLIFHRVIPGFVIQGGDASKSNKSRPLIDDKELDSEFHPEMCHYKGALAMARMPDNINPQKKSSPDQFYIVHGSQLDAERLAQLSADGGREYKSYQREKYIKLGGSPQLDGEYTVFGYLLFGMAIIDSIALTPTGAGDLPEEPIYMTLRMVR
jgi:peptidyl-prolyl cis-trans isomerase B (cyclophilin B)